MKNSKEYSRKIQKLFRVLRRKYAKPQPLEYDEPVDAVVYALISEKMSGKTARSAIRRFDEHFINLHELRVSRTDEIVEVLGQDTSETREIASSIIGVLSSVFGKYNTTSLKNLKKARKKSAKQILGKIDGITPFALDYCMLTALQAHAIPLTVKMTEFLRSNHLVEPDADTEQIKGFLARQIPAKNAYEFYNLLRRHSESSRTARKKTDRKIKKKKTKGKQKT